MQRMFAEKIYGEKVITDDQGLIRMDDWEMRDDVQEEVNKLWNMISDETLEECTDIKGYQRDFSEIFGFDVDGVDYEADVDTSIGIPSIIAE